MSSLNFVLAQSFVGEEGWDIFDPYNVVDESKSASADANYPTYDCLFTFGCDFLKAKAEKKTL